MNSDDQTRHFKDELQLLLDDRLSPAERAELERHLTDCSICQRELHILRWTKQLAAQELASVEVPAQLEKNILLALDREDRTRMDRARPGPLGSFMRPGWAYALTAAIAAALVMVWLLQPQTTEIPCQIAHAFLEYRENRLPLEIRTSDVKEIEDGFKAAGVPFPTRVFDLGMMGIQALGGTVYELADRPSAFFVYRNEAGDLFACQMYLGHVSELPVEARHSIRENQGIQFYVYQERGLTMVFWQEGDVTCVLTSDVDAEEVIQLAFGKAVKI